MKIINNNKKTWYNLPSHHLSTDPVLPSIRDVVTPCNSRSVQIENRLSSSIADKTNHEIRFDGIKNKKRNFEREKKIEKKKNRDEKTFFFFSSFSNYLH